MAKVTEYSRITKMKDNDVLLVDGPDGTRIILQTDASKQMGGEVIMVNETAGDSTKVVINTTDEEIELATMADLEPVEEDVDELKELINPLYGNFDFTLVENSYWPSAGANAGMPRPYNGWSRTDRIPCTPGEILKITTSVASAYNVFFNTDTDGDVNSAFSLTVGENEITVPNGAYYFGLSNTNDGMDGTEIIKIIDANDLNKFSAIVKNALSELESDNDAVKIWVELSDPNKPFTPTTLYATSSSRRRTDYNSAIDTVSIKVNAVTGFQHNINYFMEQAADGISETGWQTTETTFVKPNDLYNFWFVNFKKSDNTNFSESDVADLLSGLVITKKLETNGLKETQKTVEDFGRYIGFYDPSNEYKVTNLIAVSAINNKRTEFISANGIKSISVNGVSGYQHNINYFKVAASDSDAVAETGWQNDTTTLAKPEGYNFWYVRFRKADQSEFTDADVTTLLQSLVITQNFETIDIPLQVVYVSTNGNDNNPGTKTQPFATLQKAVNSGALVIKASAGQYAGFSVENRENPLTIMLDSMPVYSTANPEVPKIKITTGVSNGYGIYADNCTEINLFDIWVDGVTADCVWIQNVGNIECTRCYVSNNTADNSMGFRLISVNGVFRDCKAWNIVKDGYNIHRYGNTQFINCVAYDCGDDGISHHDGCTGLISGGEYYRCYKGGISSPYGGSKIDIENVYIHDCSQYGIYSMSTAEMLKSSGRISNCVIKNNGTYDIIASYTDLIGWNNIYDTKSIGTEATFTELS